MQLTLDDRVTCRGVAGCGPRPGDRVPNIATRDADGHHAPLHSQLGTGWALLTSGSVDNLLDQAAQRLGTDHVQALTPQTGTLREVCLIRPDAHLAWRGTHSDDLGRWLDAALRREQTAHARHEIRR